MKTDQNLSTTAPARANYFRKRAAALLTVLLAVVLSPLAGHAAGKATQFIWSTTPGSTTAGSPFGQQPVLVSADAAGNPSTIGLPTSVIVTVDTVPAGALVGGAFSFDIGTGPGASNGVAIFHGLQINTLGGYLLTAVTGNGTNAVDSPTNGISNCQLWLDASDMSTITLNANFNVSAWGDKSGTGNNATNNSVAGLANALLTNSNPNLSALAAGGQHVMTFHQTNRLNINLNVITNSTYSIIALTQMDPLVVATNGVNNDFYIGDPFTGAGTDRTLHIGYRNPTQYTFAQYADDLNVTFPNPPQFPSGPLIASHIHTQSPNRRQLYLNGQAAGNSSMANLGPISQANIGRANGGSFRGDMAEVIVYNTNLTELQRIGVENYLANKWLNQFNAGATTPGFFVGNGVPVAGIAFAQQPVDTVAGGTITPAVTVVVTNSGGGGISGLPITLSVASGTGTLNGTLIQTSDGTGTATYNDLNFTVAGPKVLKATILAAGTNTSGSFNIFAGPATQLVITTQPSTTGTAGTPLARQPVVSFEDIYNNVVSNRTDMVNAFQDGGFGYLNGTFTDEVSVTAVAGTATFTGLFITNSGVSTLEFGGGGLPDVISGNVTISAGIPNLIAIIQPPSTIAEVGVPLDIQPVITVQDVYGNYAANGTIVSASGSPSFLLGTTNVGTVSGAATYAGLNFTNLGSNVMVFKAGTGTNVVSVTSAPLTVGVGPVSQVVWTTQPGGGVTGSPLSTQPALRTADSGGNLSTVGLAPTNIIVVSQLAGSGLVGGPMTFNIGTSGSNGVITFSNLQVNNAGTSNVLAADYLGATTSPTNGIPNCILWLDASDLSMLSTTNATNQLALWLDKSGTTNNAANSNSFPVTLLDTALPATSYGGQHAVHFSGTNLLYIDLTPINSSDYTIIALETATSSGATVGGSTYFIGSDFTSNGNGVGNDHVLHFGYQAANQFRWGHYADDLTWTAPANFTLATPRVWSGDFTAGTKALYLNGTLAASGSAAQLTLVTNGAVGRGNGSYYVGDMSEIVVFNRGLADNERQSIEQYLTHKWVQKSRSLTTPFAVASLVPTLTISPNGANMTLTVTGAPGRSYRVLATTDLTVPTASWTPIGTNTMDVTGTWQVNDPNNQAGRYYKAVTP